ncbi:tat pathway signal sequence [Colletotrichum graminicola]|uniref:endo-1,3(4)-beta-glucanase n=1 Tax=Colletotrichum graminicola (strain M1.001 / M2 / FGSC 10212) TaxID=645133 RepID=E3Q6R0_COLGM|nr:tat pathway signal sequence [Colletotrichum graminicola M1.001]EFQ26508.1 tat pathway signal sequence [Colletotrichum graminicola M1.001]WDK14385.1 tat pathway signal sequence [Colletotrichum graminicola]
MPSQNIKMLLVGAAALLLSCAPEPAQAQQKYVLHDNYDASNFFDEFSFFDEADPTRGSQQYTSAQTANDQGLAGYARGGIYLGVDSKTTGQNRQSVRVTSNKAFDTGLFVADIQHMPTSSCAVWPAFWMFGPNWPNSGEIDIIEGVNTQESNSVTLHTGPGCSINNDGSLSSTKLNSKDCNNNSAFTGCGQDTASNQNYGDGFNAIGGGVYALDFNSQAISVWFFPRSSIPGDISSGNPNPASWGQPMAKFNGGAGCDIPSHFKQQNLVFNIALCGDWAGKVWDQNAECKALAPQCSDYVAANPQAFTEAFWLINSVKVYQSDGGANGSVPSAPQPSGPPSGPPAGSGRPNGSGFPGGFGSN